MSTAIDIGAIQIIISGFRILSFSQSRRRRRSKENERFWGITPRGRQRVRCLETPYPRGCLDGGCFCARIGRIARHFRYTSHHNTYRETKVISKLRRKAFGGGNKIAAVRIEFVYGSTGLRIASEPATSSPGKWHRIRKTPTRTGRHASPISPLHPIATSKPTSKRTL